MQLLRFNFNFVFEVIALIRSNGIFFRPNLLLKKKFSEQDLSDLFSNFDIFKLGANYTFFFIEKLEWFNVRKSDLVILTVYYTRKTSFTII